MRVVSKEHLDKAVSACKDETTSALQLMYYALNQGQQKKLLKNEDVKKLLTRYGIVEGGEL